MIASTKEIEVTPTAESDIASAVTYLESQRPGSGKRFLQELNSIFARIAWMPYSYQELSKKARRALVRRFGYWVVYRVRVDVIQVVAVISSASSPDKILQRACKT